MSLSLIYSESFASKTCLTQPKGTIFYGSPGTEKTSITRTICDLLNIEPKIFSGPETSYHTPARIRTQNM